MEIVFTYRCRCLAIELLWGVRSSKTRYLQTVRRREDTSSVFNSLAHIYGTPGQVCSLSRNTLLQMVPPVFSILSITAWGNGVCPCMMKIWRGTVGVQKQFSDIDTVFSPSSFSSKSSANSSSSEPSSLAEAKKSPVASTISNFPCFWSNALTFVKNDLKAPSTEPTASLKMNILLY